MLTHPLPRISFTTHATDGGDTMTHDHIGLLTLLDWPDNLSASASFLSTEPNAPTFNQVRHFGWP